MIIKRDYIKCGEGCGERPILSTKYGESLPLRQILDFAKKLELHFRLLFGSVLPALKPRQG